jgi:type IV secretory pathway protease TraF
MVPALESGDWALAVRARRIRPGDVVVVEHPDRAAYDMVKRVVTGPGERAPDGRELRPGEMWIEGDALEMSTDSRRFGPVAGRSVAGRVVLVWWPPPRWGRP